MNLNTRTIAELDRYRNEDRFSQVAYDLLAEHLVEEVKRIEIAKSIASLADSIPIIKEQA